MQPMTCRHSSKNPAVNDPRAILFVRFRVFSGCPAAVSFAARSSYFMFRRFSSDFNKAFAAAQVLAISAGDKPAVAFFADQICRSAQKILLN